MKLKDTFVTHMSDDVQILIDAGGANFMGLVRSNPTAAFIVDFLKKETTPDAIVAAMHQKYDAPEGAIERDVEKIIGNLRSIHALDE